MKLKTKPTGAEWLTIIDIEKLATLFEIDDNGCWNWLASKTTTGYGEYWNRRKGFTHVLAHRLMYELINGSILGLVPDHLCENTLCCNPSHLSIGSQADNVLRGNSPHARHARQTHCKRGHEFTTENTYKRPSQNWRECIACRNSNPTTSGEDTPTMSKESDLQADSRKKIEQILGYHWNEGLEAYTMSVDKTLAVNPEQEVHQILALLESEYQRGYDAGKKE